MDKDDAKVNAYLRIILGSSVVVFIGLLISKVFSYIYRILIARYFGPETYGLFSLTIIIVGWFVTVAGLGLSDGILRYLILFNNRKGIKKAKYIFRYTIITSLITGVMAGAVLFLFSDHIAFNFFKDAQLSYYLKWFSISVPMLVITHIYLSLLRAHNKIGWYSFILNVLQNVAKVVILLFMMVIGFRHSSLIVSYAFATLSMLVVAYYASRSLMRKFSLEKELNRGEKKNIGRQIFLYSLPLLFYNLLYVVFYWIDSLALGYYKDVAIVGLYNAAVPIALLLGFTSELFIQIFLPIITKAYALKDKKLIEQLSKQVTKWILLINLPIALMLVIFPEYFLLLLFGEQFTSASNALRILALGSFFSSLFVVWHQIIYAQGRSKDFFVNMVLASLLNIVLNALLIPLNTIGSIDNSTGMVGAGIATFASILLFNVLFLKAIKNYLGAVPLRRKMINIIAAAVFPAILVSWLWNSLPSSYPLFFGLAILFGALYMGLVIVFRCLDRNDRALIRQIKDKVLHRIMRVNSDTTQ